MKNSNIVKFTNLIIGYLVYYSMDGKKYIIVKDGKTPISTVVADVTKDMGVPVSKGECLPSILKKISEKIAAPHNYIHTQSTAASTWVVNHNLGYKPGGIMVLDSAGTQWFGSVIHINDNTLSIDFGGAVFGGKVYIS